MLLSLGPASLTAGIVLILLVVLRPSFLFQDLLLSVGVFIITFGMSAICIVKGTDVKINKAITEASRRFCTSVEIMIRQEKNLRNLDHAFRLLILMEALTLVKRMFAAHTSGQQLNNASQRAKVLISESIDKLRASIQVDVNEVLKSMLNETDEVKQVKNIDFIFRVCIPLYFLADVRTRSGEEAETIQAILMNAQYQLLIN